MIKNDGNGGKVDLISRMNIDNIFFDYIGLNVREHRKRLQTLVNCSLKKAYIDGNVTEISGKIIDNAFGVYIFQDINYLAYRMQNSGTDMEQAEWQYVKEQLQWLGMIRENYNDDLDVAMFMLIGSYYSDFCEYVDNMPSLPFLHKDKKRSTWCRVFQDVMTKNNRIQLIDLENVEKKEHQRIEKYSYKRCMKMHTEIYELICEIKSELEIEKGKQTIKQREAYECRKSKVQCMSEEGIENYYLEDMIFGLSFTEILYHYMKNTSVSQLEQSEKIIELLARVKCRLLRNKITDVIFFFLVKNKFSDKSILNISNYLEAYVEKINQIYADLLCVEWSWFWNDEIKKKRKEVIWKKIIKEDFYDVKKNIFFSDDSNDKYLLKKYFQRNWYVCTPYNEELQNDIEKDMQMVHSTSIYHGNSNNPSYDGLQMLLQVKALENSGISLEEIESSNKTKWGQKEETRTGKAGIKEKQVAYTLIHKQVMVALNKSKSSGKNPTA